MTFVPNNSKLLREKGLVIEDGRVKEDVTVLGRKVW